MATTIERIGSFRRRGLRVYQSAKHIISTCVYTDWHDAQITAVQSDLERLHKLWRKFNPFMGTSKPPATNHHSAYGDWYSWPLMVGCYIWYSELGPGRAAAPPSPLIAVQNVTAHQSTVSVPTSYYWMWHVIAFAL